MAIGCGSSSSSPGPAKEGGADVTNDSPIDVHVNDVASEASEAGHEAGVEGGAEAGDAGIDASAIENFASALAAARCQNWLSCCPGGDAGAYSLSACTDTYRGYGWEGNLPDNQTALGRGFIVIDSVKAAACVAAVQALPCGQQTAAQWSSVTQACELVLTGTIPIGSSGCVSSFECANGAYCSTNDGGVGSCVALATQGQPCNTVISSLIDPRADYMCSYLGSSSNGMFCDLINNPANSATCQPLLANGINCVAASGYYDDQACPSSGALCGDNSQCGGSASYPYPGNCTPYLITDAGGGG
ncbi:MAG: hypothetical protein ACRELB_13370 [Polyangiaceae bacterium]